jgi:hypothetical protein
MKFLMIPVLCALAAGCVTVPSAARGNSELPESSEDREAKAAVREAFNQLHAAWRQGDAMGALGLMSVQGVSDWVLERTRDKSDPEWPKIVAKLDAARKVDFEAWVRGNKPVLVPFVDDRSAPLPTSVLASQWLVETWKRYVELEKASLAAIAKSLEVSEVYVEGTDASVFVKAGKTPVRMYSMVLEDGRWKFDYDVRPAGRKNK